MKRLIKRLKNLVQSKSKMVFIIIIIAFAVIYLITMIQSIKTTQNTKVPNQTINQMKPLKEKVTTDFSNTLDNINELMETSNTLHDLRKIEQEFYSIAKKEKMTKVDSLRLIELYQEIKAIQNANQP